MKINKIACLTALLMASLAGAQAQTTLTAWNFDNLAVAPNTSPAPSTGFGSASALGLDNSFNGTNSTSNPDVLSLVGSSTSPVGPLSWRIRGAGGNGWSTNAPIGSQGALFAASTFGFYKIKVSFDVYATTDAEANLQVQYTTDGGHTWKNSTITSVGTLAVITNNSSTSNSTVTGSYVILTNNGTTGWNNQITVDLTGVSGVDNNTNFAVRMVNASTDTNCVDTTGAIYNNTSGSWAFDNVVVQGTSFDTVTAWTFESEGTAAYVPHPVPEFGSGTATGLGMDNNYNFSDGTVGSTNTPDTLGNGIPFSSTGASGQNVWRVRGSGTGKGHNGWNTSAPIGTQGAEFDVDTTGYTDVIVSFDLFSTSQGEAKMCVMYTTNNWTTTINASNLFYGANPTFMFTNVPGPTYSSDTVTGTYFWQNVGQNFYNNFVVDFTGYPNVANNPGFGFRVVNAAQGNDCLAYNGGSYNNSSGNWRYDNVTVSGTFNGSVPPVLTNDSFATVDHVFTNTFTDDPTWRTTISSIYVNGSLLTNTAYSTNIANQITYNPANSVLLQSSGVKNIVINAAGYRNVKVTQPVAAGVAAQLLVNTQPSGPSASGGTLIANPIVALVDQYGNGSTNPYANVTVTATAGGAGGWTLGGSNVQAAVGGFATFTNLSAKVNSTTAVSGAAITFTVTGYTNTANSSTTTNFNSTNFNISAPPAAFTRGNLAAIQIDTVANNTTFSLIEVKASTAKQTNAVNIVPISATGTNALRLTSAGSAGRLSLSDDGTLLCFVGFADDSSATLDETFNQNRAVGTLNYTNLFTKPFSYSSVSFGGSQGRSCATLDNTNWLVVDKGGLYINSLLWSQQNNVVVRTFGGVPYVETQKTAGGSPLPVVYSLAMDNPATINHAVPNNLITDPLAVDFYIVSTNNGDNSIMYVLDQVSSTFGLITKYSWVVDPSQLAGYGWATNGTFATTNGGDSLFATTNGSGGVYLYYTTGGGGTAANSIVRLTDSAGYNANMNIVASNVIYTASATTSVKGLTFVPQQLTNAPELIPTPILTAQTTATVDSAFTVTNTPDDAGWRAAITSITVNGTTLASSAYNKTTAGKIVFTPSQSALLQSVGAKTIVFNAPGYSTNSVVQTLAVGAAAKLAVTTQPTAPAADGGVLAVQPVVAIQDQYGNATTSTANITATVGSGSWTIGGTATRAAVSGTATFSGLTAFSTNSVTGATIHFASGALTAVNSSAFNIPAPVLANLTGTTLTPAGKLKFTFTNPTGLSFTVLSSTNVTTAVTNWTVVGPAVETPVGSGTYLFTNSTGATNAKQYFLLRQP